MWCQQKNLLVPVRRGPMVERTMMTGRHTPSYKMVPWRRLKMMKSSWMRLSICMLCAIAMIAVLGGCAKKEKAQTENAAESTEAEHSHDMGHDMSMAGTYSTPLANGTATLMLNDDMTATFSLQPMENAPAQTENGTWAEGDMHSVDVTFTKEVEDSTMSMTLNFAANGDSLTLTNGDVVGLGGMVLVRQ